tara:strand:+ start:1537 stop:1734 length:198 start_codon:yes stop_codon:yes gene_type:complete
VAKTPALADADSAAFFAEVAKPACVVAVLAEPDALLALVAAAEALLAALVALVPAAFFEAVDIPA